MADGAVVIIGGTGGMGRELAVHYLEKGRNVVVTGRDAEKARAVASELGENASGIGFNLARPETIASALADLGPVDRLVLSAIDRDNNPVREYNYESATNLATMKIVGYTETVHALIPNLSDDSSVVLFGGRAKDRPYPGSTTVTAVNGAVATMITTLAIELAPIRFNAIHPGIVGDSPFWEGKALDAILARTPTNRLATMSDVVDATVFLLENRSVNGVNLYVDGGWLLM
ncbi:MAG TPA: SDR family oxidoreductase [Acidimicrobiia bacterium]|jgi:NAD(P)-dependent dehydrogenase (short-subunit alcohol dehydrogenase family)